MSKINKLIILVIILFSGGVFAEELHPQIESFILAQYDNQPNELNIVYTKSLPEMNCERPMLSLSNNGRIWGNITLTAQCNKEKRFIPLQVQVIGQYVVAATTLSAGQLINQNDLKLIDGRLDKLPPRTLLSLESAANSVSLRQFVVGQPITQNMLRRHWIIQAGQSVKINATGAGFSIASEGKALNNAAVNDVIRVRTNNGTVVSGSAGADGSVQLML